MRFNGTGWVPAGTSWYRLVPAGTSWYQLGTSWYQLGTGWYPLGTSWSQLVPAGPNWSQLVPAGTSWCHLVPAGYQLGTSLHQLVLVTTAPISQPPTQGTLVHTQPPYTRPLHKAQICFIR